MIRVWLPIVFFRPKTLASSIPDKSGIWYSIKMSFASSFWIDKAQRLDGVWKLSCQFQKKQSLPQMNFAHQFQG